MEGVKRLPRFACPKAACALFVTNNGYQIPWLAYKQKMQWNPFDMTTVWPGHFGHYARIEWLQLPRPIQPDLAATTRPVDKETYFHRSTEQTPNSLSPMHVR